MAAGRQERLRDGSGTRSVSQHDARRQEDGTITIFDNGAPPQVHEQSRTIVVSLDMDAMSANLVREYTHRKELVSTSQGNAQVLPNGNVFVGWGSAPFFSEYSKEGELLFDASFRGSTQSYRAFRLPWTGHPTYDPAVAVERGSDDKVTLYVSWNGATDVATWQVLAGPDPSRLEPPDSLPSAASRPPLR